VKRLFRRNVYDVASLAPGVLHRGTFEGEPIVKGKRVTGFTNDDEEEVHLTHVAPFLVEDELKRLRGMFEKLSN
jgi:hypothetical protein